MLRISPHIDKTVKNSGLQSPIAVPVATAAGGVQGVKVFPNLVGSPLEIVQRTLTFTNTGAGIIYISVGYNCNNVQYDMSISCAAANAYIEPINIQSTQDVYVLASAAGFTCAAFQLENNDLSQGPNRGILNPAGQGAGGST